MSKYQAIATRRPSPERYGLTTGETKMLDIAVEEIPWRDLIATRSIRSSAGGASASTNLCSRSATLSCPKDSFQAVWRGRAGLREAILKHCILKQVAGARTQPLLRSSSISSQQRSPRLVMPHEVCRAMRNNVSWAWAKVRWYENATVDIVRLMSWKNGTHPTLTHHNQR